MKDLNFEKLITSTGVPLYVMYLPHSNTVASGVLVKAGTRDEIWPQEAGLAHALEHMVFQGTKNFATSEKLAAYIEETGGDIDAWTWKEGTFYWNRLPTKYKERSTFVLAEMINEALIPKEKIPIQMKSIVEEIRRAKDNPLRYLYELAEPFLYSRHPLSKMTLGTEESVLKFERKHFIEFKKRYYDPVNFIFIIAGSINAHSALELFEKNFPKKKIISENVREKLYLTDSKQRKLIHKKELEQVHILLVAPVGEANGKLTKAVSLFTTMISGGMSFPLFQEVRDKRGLCYAIGASVTKFSDVGKFDLYIGTNPKHYQEAIDVSLAVINENKNNELLLQKAKSVELGNLALQYENTGAIINIAAHDILEDKKPKGYSELQKEIESITIKDIEKAVDTYLKPEDIRQVLLVPKGLKIG